MTERDLTRIAFVTRRFWDLQGLKSAAMGTGLIVGVFWYSVAPPEVRDPYQQVVMPALVLMLASVFSIHNYYSRAFGRVPPLKSRMADGKAIQPDTMLPLVLQFGLMTDMVRAWVYPGGPSAAAIVLVGYASWVLVLDYRYRPYYFLGVAGGVLSLAATWSAPFVRGEGIRLHPQVATAYVVAYSIIGLTLVVVGLLDHRLMSLAILRGRQSTAVRVPDQANSRLRALFAAVCLLIVLAYFVVIRFVFGEASAQAHFLFVALYLAFIAVGVFLGRQRVARLRAQAEDAATHRREARLEAQVAAMHSQTVPAVGDETETEPFNPPFDAVAQVAIPIGMAAGGLIDLIARGSGLPSMLALACVLLHLRIAMRDWPLRSHYLLGASGSAVSAALFAALPADRFDDWLAWSLLIASTVVLVESWRDARLPARRST